MTVSQPTEGLALVAAGIRILRTLIRASSKKQQPQKYLRGRLLNMMRF